MKRITVREAVAAIGGKYYGTPEALNVVIENMQNDSRLVLSLIHI